MRCLTPHAVYRAGGAETTPLDICLTEYAELSVEGNTAIHLAGYYLPADTDFGGFDDDDEEDEEFGEEGEEEEDDEARRG